MEYSYFRGNPDLSTFSAEARHSSSSGGNSPECFPRNCIVLGDQFYYCVNCGAFDKKIANMKRHFGVRTDVMGCSVAIHMKCGTV
eukprot:scaffold16779_cov125-Skeletonema_dohrnii-CCMP3373.AAC.1